jgi:hypothetical protein
MLPLDFSVKEYNYELFEWYSPVFVLQRYNDLFRKYPEGKKSTLFKKAHEAAQAAVALLGARALHEDNKFIMQMNRQSKRPDVIAATMITLKGAPALSINPLEIIELEMHTGHNDVAKFLIEKKLTKSYPPETMFLCYVNKPVGYDIRVVSNRIKETGKKNSVYLFGKTKRTGPMNFFIGSPQPIVANIPFDVAQQSIDYPYPVSD